MASKSGVLFLLAFLLGVSFNSVEGRTIFPNIKTVTNLNIDNYVGRWYEMYSDLVVKATFERNSYCTTATYGKINDTAVTVFNSGRLGSPTGPPSEIRGMAYVADAAEPGQLKLKFPNIPLGDYWVIALGPVEDNEYQYAVVTEPMMLQLFILARDPDEFRQKYEDDVLDIVKNAGFTRFYNKPRETVQVPDCIYPPSSKFLYEN
ncbi:outer membrane lipoprotein Blc-like [Lytechinus variegatus]|uniref:outer membrane lipoprotein Blc-like n=1 Tax=Lytechinus variegatus TaxID=7654 RepID=UPI001BB14092|nr:outer membrane lipoprotein Blc-like [Lytechinus variegatus]